jgi:spoIIIJ-associated protein
VHSEVQKIEGVTSHSVGSEPRRKVVITLEGASSDDGRRSRRNRSGKAGKVAEETTSETTNKVKVNDIPVRKELKSTEEFIGSLYGKIEL